MNAETGRAGDSQPTESAIETAKPAGRPLLYTPAQAAPMLAITEAWLRRKAGQRLIPCSRVGKRLLFSDADLQSIVAAAQQPASTETPRTTRVLGRPPRRRR
jgi:hypothetical protein